MWCAAFMRNSTCYRAHNIPYALGSFGLIENYFIRLKHKFTSHVICVGSVASVVKSSTGHDDDVGGSNPAGSDNRFIIV